MPHPATIHPHKTGNPVGFKFIELQSVDSTNNYAMAQVHAGLAISGTVFFAHDQYAGKGQRGKSWIAEPGENIMMSILLQLQFLSPNRQFELSACIALACHDFLRKYLANETTVKWPNDLYWRDRKAGGILIENILQGNHWAYAVVGIGININQAHFPEPAKNAVSIRQVTGKTHDTVTLAKELCLFIENRYSRLPSESFNKLLEEYQAALYKINQPVQLKKEGKLFNTVIRGVDATGRLLTSDSADGAFDFGTVEWIIPD